MKVIPHDYKRALEHSDRPLSTGGEGFLTAETETDAEAARRVAWASSEPSSS